MQKHYVKARSCLDYMRRGKFENGFYWLFDDQDKRYVAYCDLSSEPGAAWTLVMSWSLANNDLPQLKSKAFTQDAPVNHNTPNWYSYRQTLARMRSVRSRSTHWRATCGFDQMQQKIDYRDYLRGKFSDLDIITQDFGGRCSPVDYVNIRGHAAGSGTTASFHQYKNLYPCHIQSASSGCTFRNNVETVSSEDNFGYHGTINKNFRCTMTDDSTTQWWFGGYMAD